MKDKFKKINLKTFSPIQVIFLLSICLVIIYAISNHFIKYYERKDEFEKNKVPSKVPNQLRSQPNDVKPKETIPKLSENYDMSDTFKLKYFYFISKNEGVSFRSREGDTMFLELEYGINQNKLDSLKFLLEPEEPLEVKLEKPNFVSVKFLGEIKPSLDPSSLKILEGENLLFNILFYNYSDEMLPKDKNYIPTPNLND